MTSVQPSLRITPSLDYAYYSVVQKYTKIDKWGLKTYIFILYTLDTVYQALLLNGLYSYFVTGFADVADLGRNKRPVIVVSLFAAFINGLSQCLYVMRVWHLSKGNYILTGVLAALVLGQFAVTTVYFGLTYNLPEISELTTGSVIRTEFALDSIVAITDMTIATVIVLLLRSSRSGVRQTDSLINCLILYTVSSSVITSIVALGTLITAVVLPKTFIYLLSDLVIPKLYLNSTLAMLNSRQRLRNGFHNDSGNGISLSNILPRCVGSVSARNAPASTDIAMVNIRIDTEQTSSNGTVEHKRAQFSVDDVSSYAPEEGQESKHHTSDSDLINSRC